MAPPQRRGHFCARALPLPPMSADGVIAISILIQSQPASYARCAGCALFPAGSIPRLAPWGYRFMPAARAVLANRGRFRFTSEGKPLRLPFVPVQRTSGGDKDSVGSALGRAIRFTPEGDQPARAVALSSFSSEGAQKKLIIPPISPARNRANWRLFLSFRSRQSRCIARSRVAQVYFRDAPNLFPRFEVQMFSNGAAKGNRNIKKP